MQIFKYRPNDIRTTMARFEDMSKGREIDMGINNMSLPDIIKRVLAPELENARLDIANGKYKSEETPLSGSYSVITKRYMDTKDIKLRYELRYSNSKPLLYFVGVIYVVEEDRYIDLYGMNAADMCDDNFRAITHIQNVPMFEPHIVIDEKWLAPFKKYELNDLVQVIKILANNKDASVFYSVNFVPPKNLSKASVEVLRRYLTIYSEGTMSLQARNMAAQRIYNSFVVMNDTIAELSEKF
jgi:hypothetical protein